MTDLDHWALLSELGFLPMLHTTSTTRTASIYTLKDPPERGSGEKLHKRHIIKHEVSYTTSPFNPMAPEAIDRQLWQHAWFHTRKDLLIGATDPYHGRPDLTLEIKRLIQWPDAALTPC